MARVLGRSAGARQQPAGKGTAKNKEFRHFRASAQPLRIEKRPGGLKEVSQFTAYAGQDDGSQNLLSTVYQVAFGEKKGELT